MADCSHLSGEKPEVSLIPLNEEMIRMERMVGHNKRLPEYILPGHNSEISDSSIQIDNMICVHLKQTSDVHSYPSQKYGNLPVNNECTNVARDCDCKNSGRADPSSVAQLEGMHKAVGRSMEQSGDFVDSGIDNLFFCSEAADVRKTGCFQTVCNGSFENSQCKSDSNASNTVIPENPSKDNSVFGAESTYASVNSRGRSVGSMEESFHENESVNTLLELNSPGGNKTFKPCELINQLVEGPCITMPSSQLPVISSCPSSYAQIHQKQSTCSTSASSGIPGLLQMLHSEDLTHGLHSGGHKITHNEDSTPRSVNTAPYASPGSVSQHILAENQITTKQKQVDVSESTNEQVIQTAVSTPTPKPAAKRTPNDFVFGKVIGEGSYSTVYLAKEVSSQREFAIKVCDKKHLIRERKTHFVMREKEVLMKLDHPFFIKLAYTFQDSERLYYVLTYACNGELLGYLHKLSAFDVPCTRFYSAEIILALEYLHGLGIIHRDLKPENILISEDMHIRITDFGTSKILSPGSDKAENQADVKRKNSFVGTAEYVSPEVLNNQPANFGSDLWGLGCIIYQCLSGSLPFRSGNEYQTFQKIVKAEYEFPEGFNTEAKDLVKKLLVLEPSARLGMAKPEGMKALKNHSFYEGIDWETLPEATPPKLMPYLPATANNPEFWGQEQRTGFDDQRLAEIITGQSADSCMSSELEELPIRILSQAENSERTDRLRKQRTDNKFHQFVQDNLIIKQGFVDKRKGLFARKRMLLLTEGPHLYYVDAHNKVLKGEIPWSKYLRPEAKNFKIFFVHTPNRTYYLESRQPDAQDWVKQIKDMWIKYYDNGKNK